MSKPNKNPAELVEKLVAINKVSKTVKGGKKAENKAWEGAMIGTPGLEWTLPSPPPHHTFTIPPVVR